MYSLCITSFWSFGNDQEMIKNVMILTIVIVTPRIGDIMTYIFAAPKKCHKITMTNYTKKYIYICVTALV